MNDLAQLGDGRLYAPNISVPGLAGATQIAMGKSHVCALISDGTVKCWGVNTSGQLGDGTLVTRSTPAAVSGLTGVAEISAGEASTCARLTSGTVKCWGYNLDGELGDGTTTQRTTPVPVSGLSGVASISQSDGIACARLTAGTVKCWGKGASGVGDGTYLQRNTPVFVTGLSGVAAISTGVYYSCAQLTDGTAKCWGGNSGGQLGDGTTTTRLTPVAVSNLSGVAEIYAGAGSTCARLTSGMAKCWGGNTGNGTTTPALTPVSVQNLSGVARIAPGATTCATLTDGTLTCWGGNTDGQLGSGDTTARYAPGTVVGISGVAQVAFGRARVCARLTDGTVKCWGAGEPGFHDHTTADQTRPVVTSSGSQLTWWGTMASQGSVLVRKTADGGTMMGHVTPVPYSTYYTNNGAKVPAFMVDYNPLAAAAALFIQQYDAHINACNGTTPADAATLSLDKQYAGGKLAACLDATDKSNYLSGTATLLAGAKTYLLGGSTDCITGLGSCTTTSITNSITSPAHFPFSVVVPDYSGSDAATAPYTSSAYYNTVSAALATYRTSILGGSGTGLEKTLQLVGIAKFDTNAALVTSRVTRPANVDKCIDKEAFAAQGVIASCGDGVCSGAETATSCATDCATP